MTTSDYEVDFFQWTNTQAKFLKKLEFKKLDIENLVEEIETLGRSEKRTLKSHLEVLLMHMLKYCYQTGIRSKSWELRVGRDSDENGQIEFSIRNSRDEFKETLEENPSLKPKLENITQAAYRSARLKAAIETGLEESTFPKTCPWDEKQISNDGFFGSNR